MMQGYVLSIRGETPYTQQQFSIETSGKNLIITGKNGSGKTSFLKKLHETIVAQIQNKEDDQQLTQLQQNIHFYEQRLKDNIEGSSTFAEAKQYLNNYLYPQYSQLQQRFVIEYVERYSYAAAVDNGTAIVDYFEATRQSSISEARNAGAIDTEKTKTTVLQNRGVSLHLGNELEQYLVNLQVRLAFAKNNQDNALVNEIERWFHNFDEQLKLLTEEKTAQLEFDPNKLQISIRQNDRQQYTFQQLSSGYSAIFNIYAALLVRVRYLDITPDQLKGVALIDEIDAHLHLSLQRKILPFLVKSFPNVQFIVTTHSPFVITSIEDVIIYDISKREQIENLSSYSYEAVAEGLLGVDPASDVLQAKIKELASIIENQKVTAKLKDLSNDLNAVYDKLDEESKYFVNQAKLLIHKQESGENGV